MKVIISTVEYYIQILYKPVKLTHSKQQATRWWIGKGLTIDYTIMCTIQENHLSESVHSPKNWSYDDGDVIYSTTLLYNQHCNL